VPLTSIYSKGDGVVRWRACVVPYARCVEVTGSHIGLAFNRHAYREIADDARAHGVTRTAAVLGAGTIGLSWAALFAAHDLDVRVQDPRPDLQEQLDATVAQLAPCWGRGSASRITVAPDLEAAVDGVDVVQENGPERLDLKQELWARVEAAARRRRCCCRRRPGSCRATWPRGCASPDGCWSGTRSTRRTSCRSSRSSRGADAAGGGAGSGRLLPLARQGAGRAAQGDRRLRGQPAAVRAVPRERPPRPAGRRDARGARPGRHRVGRACGGRRPGRSRATTSAAGRAASATCSSTSAPAWPGGGRTSGSPS
jgi:hypothetical protein